MSSCSAKRLRQSFHTRILRLGASLGLAAFTFLFGSTSLFAQPQPGTVLWTYVAVANPLNYIATSPALAPDGTIYLFDVTGASATTRLSAITNNGSRAAAKWTFPNSPQPYGNPIPVDSTMSLGVDGTIYFGSYDGNLYAINPDGSQKWTFYTGGGGGTPAIALDGTIYFNGYGKLYALSPGGTPKWNFIIGDASNWSSPAIGPDGTVFVISYGGALTAIHPDGSLKWVVGVPYQSPSQAPPIRSDGTIFVTGNHAISGYLYAINSDGATLWSSPSESPGVYVPYPDFGPASPAIGPDGAVYCASWLNGCLWAANSNGTQRWLTMCYSFGTNMAPTTPAIDSAGNLYYTASNSIIAISADGNVQWSIYDNSAPEVQGTSPVIGPEGTIYATLGKKLYAIAGTNTLANSSWPMAGHDLRHTGSAERPYFRNPRLQSDGTFALSFHGHLGRNYTVQTSSNLTTWTPLTNFPVTNIPMDVFDPASTNASTRFYRAVSL